MRLTKFVDPKPAQQRPNNSINYVYTLNFEFCALCISRLASHRYTIFIPSFEPFLRLTNVLISSTAFMLRVCLVKLLERCLRNIFLSDP
jgi:hypothetical protein